MKKKVLIILALVVAALSLFVFAACNEYEWGPISGGDKNGNVMSNGGFAVKQGDWVYFINGYDSSSSIDNTFGTVTKNGICRIKQNDDGTFGGTAKLVVPKQVYWTNTSSGFAVYGNWIYYASPNNDEDRTGTASTTNLDFMRTSLDGTITQLLFTASSRSLQYWFMPKRIVVYSNNTITTIDFTSLKETKEISKVSGDVVTRKIAENVTSIVFKPDNDWKGSATLGDYIFYTKSVKETYKNYNELFAVKHDTGKVTKLATLETYTAASAISLIDGVLESDSQMTLYYTKTEEGASKGLFVNKVDTSLSWSVDTEKRLTSVNQTSIYPVSYEDGALVSDSTTSSTYLLDGTGDIENVYVDANKILNSSSYSIKNVSKGADGNLYVYYCASSEPKALYRINLRPTEGTSPNAVEVITATFNVSWLSLDFITDGDQTTVYYFDSNDYNYVHAYNLASFDGNTVDETTFIGQMTKADKEAKEKAEKE